MDLVEASMKEQGGQHVHGWENITLAKEEVAIANKLQAQIFTPIPFEQVLLVYPDHFGLIDHT